MAKARAKTAAVEPIVLGATGLRQSTFPNALAVSDDGTKVATGDFDGNVRVLDIATGACIFEARWKARDHRGRHGIQHLAFSLDGSVIVALTGIGGHGNLCAGHLPSGATWFETVTDYEAVAFSPDGAQLAGITRGGFELVNGRDGTPIQRYALPKGCYAKSTIIWSGDLLVMKYYDQDASKTQSLAVFDATSFELRARYDTGIDLVRAELAFGRDGNVFAVAEVAPHGTSQRDVRIVVLDPRTGHCTTRQVAGDLGSSSTTPHLVPGLRAALLGTFKGDDRILLGVDAAAVIHTFPADTQHVAASADGAVIATTRGVALQIFDGAWNARSSAPGLSSTVVAIGFCGDDVITCDTTGIRTWSKGGAQRTALELGEAVALVDGAAVIVRDERTFVVDLPAGTARSGGIACELRHGAISPDARLVATHNYDKAKGHVLISSFDTGEQVHDIDAHGGSNIYGIAFSPDGKLVACGTWEGRVSVHEHATGVRVMSSSAPRGWGQQAFSFSTDHTLLASGDHACTVRIWQIATGKVLHKLAHQRKVIRETAFSPDGTLLASCDEASIRLWSTQTGEPRGVIRMGAFCLAWSADGTKLAAGSSGEAQIFDVASITASAKPKPKKPKSGA